MSDNQVSPGCSEVGSIAWQAVVRCPNCQREDSRYFGLAYDHESGFGEFRLQCCQSCALVWTSPQPPVSDLSKLYLKRDSRDFTASEGWVQRLRLALLRRRYQRSIEGMTSDSCRVLDYGCGNAEFLLALSTLPQISTLVGVDFHLEAPPLIQTLRRQAPLRFSYQNQESFKTDTALYDVIFVRHVLEHHPAPWDLVAQLMQKVKKGGALYFEVPNVRSIWNVIFGKHSGLHYVPRHLFHFSPQSIGVLVSRAAEFELSWQRAHVPIMGESLSSLGLGRIPNMGLLGILLFPLQIALDFVCGRSSLLRGEIRWR